MRRWSWRNVGSLCGGGAFSSPGLAAAPKAEPTRHGGSVEVPTRLFFSFLILASLLTETTTRLCWPGLLRRRVDFLKNAKGKCSLGIYHPLELAARRDVNLILPRQIQKPMGESTHCNHVSPHHLVFPVKTSERVSLETNYALCALYTPTHVYSEVRKPTE